MSLTPTKTQANFDWLKGAHEQRALDKQAVRNWKQNNWPPRGSGRKRLRAHSVDRYQLYRRTVVRTKSIQSVSFHNHSVKAAFSKVLLIDNAG